MQTFLPYADFAASAQSLDNKRLGKQRVENLQIMQTLLQRRVVNTKVQEPTGRFRLVEILEYGAPDEEAIPTGEYREEPIMRERDLPTSEWRIEEFDPKGWRNHPAVRMWRGHELALGVYQRAVCLEWTGRGYRDTCLKKSGFLVDSLIDVLDLDPSDPPWLGDESLHASHRGALMFKFPEWYTQFGWTEPHEYNYVWPV